VDRLRRAAPRAYRSATPLASERGGVSASSDRATHRQYALTRPCFLAYPPRVIPACLDAEFAVNLTGGHFRAGNVVDLFYSVTNSTTDAGSIANTTAGTSVVALSCPVAEVALDGATLRATCPPFNTTARCAAAVRNAAAAAPDVVAFHVDVPCAAPAVLAAGQRIEEGACGAGAPVGTACVVAARPNMSGPTPRSCARHWAMGGPTTSQQQATIQGRWAARAHVCALLAPARHVTCPLARLSDRFIRCAAATCAAPVLGAGEMVVSWCADASPLGNVCVRRCATHYEASGPTTTTCTRRPHVARWVSADATAAALAHDENEALACTPIASWLCHSGRDCRSIDPCAVCVAVSRGAATKNSSSWEPVREEKTDLRSPSGCRCSSTRYVGDFCETDEHGHVAIGRRRLWLECRASRRGRHHLARGPPPGAGYPQGPAGCSQTGSTDDFHGRSLVHPCCFSRARTDALHWHRCKCHRRHRRRRCPFMRESGRPPLLQSRSCRSAARVQLPLHLSTQ